MTPVRDCNTFFENIKWSVKLGRVGAVDKQTCTHWRFQTRVRPGIAQVNLSIVLIALCGNSAVTQWHCYVCCLPG